MARSMMQRRQEAERERIEAYKAVLQRVSRAPRLAPDFDKALKEASKGFLGVTIRESASWRPQMKTRDGARLRLAAARHLFARYPVPAPLERIWLASTGLEADEVALRKWWYIVAARGGSLYKEGAAEWLTRKEVHAFLNPPGDLTFEQAFWQAIARSYADDLGVALRIARSKIARTPRCELPFWREAARLFCAHPLTIEEIDDHADFLAECLRRDRDYSLKGRTLASLRRQMHEWHRDLEAVERIEAAMWRHDRAANRGQKPAEPARWVGSPLADWAWQPSAKEAAHKREEFVVTQLCSAADLVEETRAMRHCVSAYATKCVAGYASIWSLRRRVAGKSERMLTIELDRFNCAVQVRGFANRPARPDEQQVLSRWAKARGTVLV